LVVIGAAALAGHHYVRLTNDLDLGGILSLDHLYDLADALKQKGYSVASATGKPGLKACGWPISPSAGSVSARIPPPSPEGCLLRDSMREVCNFPLVRAATVPSTAIPHLNPQPLVSS